MGLDRLRRSGPEGPVVLTDLAVDSRKVGAGTLFAALPGTKVHGVRFAETAIAAGAAAILTDEEGFAQADEGSRARAVWLVAEDVRATLAHAAAAWFDAQPDTMVAVTGTNGKTSVSSFTRQLWQVAGLSAVNFGTTGVEGAVSAPLTHTTPEPVELHGLLADLADRGVTHAAMEASSHGLAQRRLDGVRLKAAGFTHLTRDHLDYHDTVEEYEAAKALLFTRVLPEGAVAVVNLDTQAGRRMAALAEGAGRKVFGVGEAEDAKLRLVSARFTGEGQRITWEYDGESHAASVPLIGAFQAENALLAAGLAVAAGAEPGAIFAAMNGLRPVAGRMELVARSRSGGAVYVDYSHTPDSVETALKALRPHVAGRLICIVGAGGDRDAGKRPLMGQAAAENADAVIVTDDNPRSEDPATIRAAVLKGAPGAREIGDRAEAIAAGVAELGPDDVLLIAGKGHETGQIVGDRVLPFSDAEVARAAVAR
nr:UDP-N-acetylmuramoyl-L-alanyl-D-glutamate--2,6-diaminopimelate ligase [Roseobacter sp. HKCCA0434]